MITVCAPDTEGRRASRAGIAAFLLCARGAGEGMTSGIRLSMTGEASDARAEEH